MKFVIYSNGQKLFMQEGINISFTDSNIIQTIDLSKATSDEIERLKKNPHDQALIDTISKR